MGNLPKCGNCQRHHTGQCRYGKYYNCGKVGHDKETCWRGTGHGNEGQDGSGNRGGNNNNDYQGRNSNDQEQGQGCGGIGHFRKVYLGTKPKCDECKFHHESRCLRPWCDRCGKEGHNKDACWAKYSRQGGNDDGNEDGNESARVPGCYKCGDVGHFRKDL
ncbi:CCHC-type zinc finger protein CG3800-like [Helianthus annuus]|uniref:CCHC-type zinc finger protein CG3800-like n=1 Tax=Helianthus annuus TaxID=4232 RepID=UPI000B8F307E|nr:CCHC-type zinc finger protein CG3800-like [Helianthus annuus]